MWWSVCPAFESVDSSLCSAVFIFVSYCYTFAVWGENPNKDYRVQRAWREHFQSLLADGEDKQILARAGCFPEQLWVWRLRGFWMLMWFMDSWKDSTIERHSHNQQRVLKQCEGRETQLWALIFPYFIICRKRFICMTKYMNCKLKITVNLKSGLNMNTHRTLEIHQDKTLTLHHFPKNFPLNYQKMVFSTEKPGFVISWI